MNVLLVDPPYRTSYPPVGLLKIGRFHRERGDAVSFVRGMSPRAAGKFWDRIYTASLFTFQWNTVVRTLRFYGGSVGDPRRDLFAGGPLATLLGRELGEAVPCRPVPGIVDSAEKIGLDGGDIDSLLPDYSLLPSTKSYPVLEHAWIASATRGCSGKCAFCSVREVDPRCVEYIPLKDQIDNCRRSLGERDAMVLLDNNVAMSPFLDKITGDLADEGFARGRGKTADFSQGFEPALFAGPEGNRRADILAMLPLDPIRIAWDFPGERDIYEQAVTAFAKRGFSSFSTPLLYGFSDRPEDMYQRLLRITELERELEISIQAEPMGYLAPFRKRRPSPGERARTWDCSEGEACRFEELLKKFRTGKKGDVEGFSAVFGKGPEDFRERLRRRE